MIVFKEYEIMTDPNLDFNDYMDICNNLYKDFKHFGSFVTIDDVEFYDLGFYGSYQLIGGFINDRIVSYVIYEDMPISNFNNSKIIRLIYNSPELIGKGIMAKLHKHLSKRWGLIISDNFVSEKYYHLWETIALMNPGAIELIDTENLSSLEVDYETNCWFNQERLIDDLVLHDSKYCLGLKNTNH